MEDLEAKLERTELSLGYRFCDRQLLKEALTHSSLKDEWNPSNERFEFLGDSILGMVISEYLFQKLPEAPEGELTRIKSMVVSRPSLIKIAKKFELAKSLRVGKGVRKQKALPHSLIANAVEAIIAAIYLDSDFDTARDFVLDNFVPLAEKSLGSGQQKNFKSLLQQHVQKQQAITPTYDLLSAEGPDHSKSFTVRARVDARTFPQACGPTKKAAEQGAARMALRILIEEEKDSLGVDDNAHE